MMVAVGYASIVTLNALALLVHVPLFTVTVPLYVSGEAEPGRTRPIVPPNDVPGVTSLKPAEWAVPSYAILYVEGLPVLE